MKRSIWQIFGHAAGLLLSLAITAPASAQTANQGQLKPEIILQLGHQAPVEGVLWVNGGKHLLSLAEDGSIVVWNIANKTILNRAQLSAKWTDKQLTDCLALESLALTPDNKFVSINYVLDMPTNAAYKCREALEYQTNQVSDTFDLQTLLPKQGGFVEKFNEEFVEEYVEGYVKYIADESKLFPPSPDGKWYPRRNHDNGKLGIFDRTDENLQFTESTCTSITHCRYGVNLVPASGNGEAIALTGNPRSYFLDADLSSDGQKLLRVEGIRNDTRARVEVLDLISSSGEAVFIPDRAYHRAEWLQNPGVAGPPISYALYSIGYVVTNDMEDALAGFPPVLIVDPECAKSGKCKAIESYGQMEPLDDKGSFTGLGSLNGCYRAPSLSLNVVCLGNEGNDFPDSNYRSDDDDEIRGENSSYRPFISGLSINPASDASTTDGWELASQPEWNGQVITAAKLSPDRQILAVATRLWEDPDKPDAKQTLAVLLFDFSTHKMLHPPRKIFEKSDELVTDEYNQTRGFSDSDVINELGFTPDGDHIFFTQKISPHEDTTDLYVMDITGKGKRKIPLPAPSSFVAVSDNHVLGLATRQLIDVTTGQIIADKMATTLLVKAGVVERSKLFWAASDDGALHFWDNDSGERLLTLYMFPDNRFFAVTPEGRYDTNLSPDTDMVRWRVSDAPWQSLAPQTFMRDFYEPGLYRKLLECRAASDCATKFKPLPSFADLTRVLPQVKISEVVESKDGRQAIVTFEAIEGFDKNAANGRVKSGLFSPRLFLNNRLIGQYPNDPYVVGARVSGVNETLDQWRKKNRVKIQPDADGLYRYGLTVPLPTRSDTEKLNFSAYAFNESRIKSDTATFVYQRKIKPTPRKPRAYIISIGINDYNEDRLDLNYAEPDAHLLADRLKTIPGYEARQLVLAGSSSTVGKPKPTDKLMIQSALALVMSGRDRSKYLARLDRAGVDARMLEASTADDIVIISFSGHGWANKDGDFYLLPSDGKWPDAQYLPEASTLLSTTDITYLLRETQAADISLIIDACHSGASVDSGGFKPGPMGDRGLGQLAFDKGIRILTAAQASDVALEDASLSHGLLTYALAGEDGGGITAESGHAERDENGRILLEKWLSYAIKRLPELAKDQRIAGFGSADRSNGSSFFFPGRTTTRKQKIQQPVLFDFNSSPSSIALREKQNEQELESDAR